VYRDGKWVNNESKNIGNNMNKAIYRLTESELKEMIGKSVKRILEGWNSNLSPDAMDDKAYMDDMWAQREKNMEDYWTEKNRRLRAKYPGKSEEWYEAMLDVFNENREPKKKITEGRPFKNNQGYSHFAVSKKSGKIVNGWDYKDYDPSELRQFKKDYFDVDLEDYGFNPKDFRILTYNYLVRNGVNPDDNANWANNDEANAEFVG
jgi:hypothetical protein